MSNDDRINPGRRRRQKQGPETGRKYGSGSPPVQMVPVKRLGRRSGELYCSSCGRKRTVCDCEAGGE